MHEPERYGVFSFFETIPLPRKRPPACGAAFDSRSSDGPLDDVGRSEESCTVEVVEDNSEVPGRTERTIVIGVDQQITVGRPRNEYNVALGAARPKETMVSCETDSSLDRSYRWVTLGLSVANATGRGRNINLIALCVGEVRDVIGRGLCLAARHDTEIESIGPESAV